MRQGKTKYSYTWGEEESSQYYFSEPLYINIFKSPLHLRIIFYIWNGKSLIITSC